jgi:hypothetical protein
VSGTELLRARFNHADLRSARFDNANLDETYLTGAKLHGASFAGAKKVETVEADWIDVSPDGASERLDGDDAVAWLIRAASAPAPRQEPQPAPPGSEVVARFY